VDQKNERFDLWMTIQHHTRVHSLSIRFHRNRLSTITFSTVQRASIKSRYTPLSINKFCNGNRVIFADFDSCLVPVDGGGNVVDEHVPARFCAYTVATDPEYETDGRTFRSRLHGSLFKPRQRTGKGIVYSEKLQDVAADRRGK